jgi:D-tagatose-1,6-bisphosphate aldolase subunit GatZ/KbaZ
MRCKGDPSNEDGGLPATIVAERAAELCQVSEKVYAESRSNEAAPVYIIGSDVPIPGGAHEDLENIKITDVEQVDQTVEFSHKVFLERGLDSAWERVIAIVVQPGIEFSDTKVIDYDRIGAKGLSKYIQQKQNLVYEAHSTDYQYPDRLQQLVQDHFAILKVGPWLTFALRESVFALAAIEEELLSQKSNVTISGMRDMIEKVMLKKPEYWQRHYHGRDSEKKLARGYSLSDRVRYYWPDKMIADSLSLLIHNLSQDKIPLSLISQYLPNQYWRVREKRIENHPVDLIYDKIGEVLKYYAQATAMAAA